jgi:hypothetical protein
MEDEKCKSFCVKVISLEGHSAVERERDRERERGNIYNSCLWLVSVKGTETFKREMVT